MLNVQIDELFDVEKIVMLLMELEEEVNDDQMTLSDVRSYIACAHQFGLSLDNKMKVLNIRLRAGVLSEERTKAVLEKSQRTLDELEVAAHMRPGVPIDPGLLESRINARLRRKETERQFFCKRIGWTSWLG